MKLFTLSTATAVIGASAVASEDSSSPLGATANLLTIMSKLLDLPQSGRGDRHFTPLRGSATNYNYEENEPYASTFGTSLFSEVCSSSNGNVLLSPLSVHKALSIVKDGATSGSENEVELINVLGPSASIGGNDDKDVQFTMASSIWAKGLRQPFVDGVTSTHSAGAFPRPTHYTPIDDWIEKETNGKIKGFLGNDEIPRDITTFVVNAVYFKGSWTYEFDPKNTVDGEFNLRDGSILPARLMTADRKMDFILESPALGGASAVLLDYGKKTSDCSDEPTEFTSIFILPASTDSDSTADVVSGLNSQSILDLMDEAWSTRVILKLPRFRLQYGLGSPESIASQLRNMGMKIAFNENILNKFDDMSYDPELTLIDVLHGSVMEVTEEGTEAAAVTVVPMGRRSLPRPPPEMTFDRPFIVAILHRKTGTPVFIGRVEEPSLDF